MAVFLSWACSVSLQSWPLAPRTLRPREHAGRGVCAEGTGLRGRQGGRAPPPAAGAGCKPCTPGPGEGPSMAAGGQQPALGRGAATAQAAGAVSYRPGVPTHEGPARSAASARGEVRVAQAGWAAPSAPSPANPLREHRGAVRAGRGAATGPRAPPGKRAHRRSPAPGFLDVREHRTRHLSISVTLRGKRRADDSDSRTLGPPWGDREEEAECQRKSNRDIIT